MLGGGGDNPLSNIYVLAGCGSTGGGGRDVVATHSWRSTTIHVVVDMIGITPLANFLFFVGGPIYVFKNVRVSTYVYFYAGRSDPQTQLE